MFDSADEKVTFMAEHKSLLERVAKLEAAQAKRDEVTEEPAAESETYPDNTDVEEPEEEESPRRRRNR